MRARPGGPRFRPGVSVGLRRASGLALLLAVLSVPGSTMAWDLLAGGLWIGLPLGVAAFLVGIRAHRELAGEVGSRIAIAAIVLAALSIGQLLVYLAASTLG